MSDDTPAPVIGGGSGAPPPVASGVIPDGAAPAATPEPPAAPDFGADSFQKFHEGLPDDLKGDSFFSEVKDFESLAKQAVNQHKLIGVDKMPAPKEDWSESEWSDHYQRLGRPESPDKYGEVTLPEGVEWEFDNEALGKWDAIFHEKGVSTDQRNEIISQFIVQGTAEAAAQQAAAEEAIASGLQAQEDKWGADYTVNTQIAQTAFAKFAPDSLKEMVANDPALANSQGILDLFHQIGQQAMDDTTRGGSAAPFAVATDKGSALSQAKALEAKHSDLIYGDPQSMPLDKRAVRDKVNKQILELYDQAYKEE